MVASEMIHRLALHRFTATHAARAAGLPATRLAVRINEGRVPTFPVYPGAVVIGRGARRTFGLPEIYVLRLVEALASGAGIEVAEAFAVVDRLRGVHLHDAVEPDFETRLAWAPQEWPGTWLHRDMSDPVYVLAANVPGIGWRAGIMKSDVPLAEALRTLPGAIEKTLSPLTPRHVQGLAAAEMPPMGAIIINLTRELVAVDAALAPLLEESSHNGD